MPPPGTVADPPAAVRRGAQAIALSAVVSALHVATAIAAIRHLVSTSSTYLDLFTGADREGPGRLIAELHSELVVHAGISGAGLAVLALLAVAVRRPWRLARTAAWLTAVALCSALGWLIALSPENLVAPDDLSGPVVNAAAANLLAGWYTNLTSVLVAAQFVVALAYSLLLLKGEAGDYYAAPRQHGPEGLWTVMSSRQQAIHGGQSDDDRRAAADELTRLSQEPGLDT